MCLRAFLGQAFAVRAREGGVHHLVGVPTARAVRELRTVRIILWEVQLIRIHMTMNHIIACLLSLLQFEWRVELRVSGAGGWVATGWVPSITQWQPPFHVTVHIHCAVFFHPKYQFRDGQARYSEDHGSANYARRSPWPMINILRTPQVCYEWSNNNNNGCLPKL